MKLKDMLYALWQKTKAPIATRRIQVNLPTTGQPRAEISAPNVSGYKFLCWLQPSTISWVGSCYVTNTGGQSTVMWLAISNGGEWKVLADGRVDISALYIRNDLA